MTRGKKVLSGFLVALVVLLIVAVFVANHLLDRYSRQAVRVLSQRAKRQGIVVSDPQYADAKIAGIRTARWKGLTAQLQFPESDALVPNKMFDVRIGEADLWLVGGGQAVLEARDVVIDATDSNSERELDQDNTATEEHIRVQRFRCQFPLDPFHPLPSLQETMPELMALMRAGATQLPLEVEGHVEFVFNDAPVKARLQVAKVDNGQALVLDAKDLWPLSEHFEEPLTGAELDLIATYPLRVAELLRIKEDAETTAADAHKAAAEVPEDAYRHVLWSYLLTRKYGARFAQRVTNAHESGDTGNTPAERRMDIHNNGIGRKLAEENVRRGDILNTVLSDARVIRSPQ